MFVRAPARPGFSFPHRISLPVLLCMVCVSAYGEEGAGTLQEAAQVAGKAVKWTLSLDPLALALIFLFLATMVGVIVKGRLRDRCLKSYHKFPVRVVLDTVSRDGRFILGNAGFEILPPEPEGTPLGNRIGFVLYQNEYGRLRYLAQDPDSLEPREAKRRRKRRKRVRRPGFIRRFGRWLSNLAGSFKDAFNDFLSLMMGRFRPQALTDLSQGREKYTGKMESELTSLLPNSNYDAILERLRGRVVEVESRVENMPPSMKGMLEEYTAAYVSVMDAMLPSAAAGEGEVLREDKEEKVRLENKCDAAVFIPEANWKILKPGEVMEIPKEPVPKPLKAARMDVLLPRTHAIVRYRLEDGLT